jgi:hypothetical protein
MPLWPNRKKTVKQGYQDLTQSVASIRPSSACLWRNLRDGATCTTRHRASVSLQARLGNPSQTCFHAKQAARSWHVSRAHLPPSVLWRNWQTEVYLVLRLKPRNHRGDFEAQITKPELSVLRPKPKTLHHLGFEAQPRNRPPILKPNRKKPSPLVSRPNQRKPSEWFWCQTTHKPSTLVLRLNQETRAPSLHMSGADRTRCHPTSRPSGHRVPDLCDHPRSSTPGLLLLPRSSSLHAMPHLPPAHHETSKCGSPTKQR